jgi:UDP-2,3-diacylglucosamine hydrolase
MPTSDRLELLSFRHGDKVAVIAGSDRLPLDVAEGLAASGKPPLVVMIEGEASPALASFEHEVLAIEDVARLLPLLRKRGVTHAVLAGGIARRPRLSALKPRPALLALLPRLLRALRKGDDGVLRALVAHIEAGGIKVVGAHEILPELLATEGRIAGGTPLEADRPDIEAACTAARTIGALDIGQGAVAIGGRVIAVEGIEGTDGLLDRVRQLRAHGRIAGSRRGVLVKCAKPGQEQRADLPSIGPVTITGVHAAGLAGIGLQAGGSLVLDYRGVVERAERLGIFVIGLRLDEQS